MAGAGPASSEFSQSSGVVQRRNPDNGRDFEARKGGTVKRRWNALLGVVLLGGIGTACGTPPAAQPEYRPTATIKDIMDSIVDPSADELWESVATVVTATGTEERQPRTDEEWKAVRQDAIRIVEAANLLLM